MHLTPLDSLIIPPDRQRQHFDEDAFLALVQSIQDIGLLNALTVRDGTLVAGERRFRAVRQLALMGTPIRYAGQEVPLGHIPTVDIGELSPAEQYAAELDENIRRADLTWQERAAAMLRLTKLREESGETQAEAVAAVASDSLPEAQPRAAALRVRRNVILAQHLDDPDVAKAKNENDAFKILVRKQEAVRNAALAAEVGREAPSALHTLVNGDCVSWLEQYTGEPFDVLLTDPPYGMDAEAFGDAAGKLMGITHEYQDTAEHAIDLIRRMLNASAQHMKPESHLYLYCDIDLFPVLRELAVQAGWTPHRTPLIHIKREGGRVPWPTCGPRRAYELVLYAVRGKKPVTAIKPDVFDTSLSEGNLGHGAQKPVEGFVELLKRSVRPGDRILDPFGGSGTTLVAAQAVQCRATVIELEPRYYGLAVRRLNELGEGAQLEIPQ